MSTFSHAASEGFAIVEPHDSAPLKSWLGFLALFDSKDGHGRCGAAMVTNMLGEPLEFRVSEPMRPSAVQRALYGDRLWPYVDAELIANRLLGELRRSPTLILTNRVSVLDVASKTTLCFVTHANVFQRSDAARPCRQLEAVGATKRALALESATGASLASCAEQVANAMRQFDPVEAFARMETAYGKLAESDGRYR